MTLGNFKIFSSYYDNQLFDAIFLKIPKYGSICETPEEYCIRITAIFDSFYDKLSDHGMLFVYSPDSQFGMNAWKVDVKKVGRERQDIHKGHSTARFFKDKYEEDTIGVAGERCFGIEFNMPVDIQSRLTGDLGVDFKYYNKTIDVKTARKAYNLLVKTHEIDRCADILVLAKFNDFDDINLLGWTTADEMKKCPRKDFGYGIVNYYKSANELNHIDELKRMFKIEHLPFQKMNINKKLCGAIDLKKWKCSIFHEEESNIAYALSKNKDFKLSCIISEDSWVEKCIKQLDEGSVIFDPFNSLKL